MSVLTEPYRFNSAIVRSPGKSVTQGLREGDGENPVYERLKAEHDCYIRSLEQAGVSVTILPALEDYPDSVFVEDAALVYANGAILLRPGAQSRQSETEKIEPVLRRMFNVVLELPAPGCADGGDILNTPKGVFIGLSNRTDQDGATGLQTCLAELGLPGRVVRTPEGVLHFKSDCSLLDEDTVLSTKRLAASGVFEEFEIVTVPDGEEGAANSLRINDVVFVGEQFQGTRALLEAKGFEVVPVPTSEIAKIDAGPSCMSLRWRNANATA